MKKQTDEKQKKHIAFYIGSLARGGAERVIVNLAEYFLSVGYRVTIVTKLMEQDEYDSNPSIERILADIEGDEISDNRVINFIARIKKLRNIWKRIKPDVIVSFIKKNNFMAITSSRFLHIPVIVSVRSAPEREYQERSMRLLVKPLFSMADGVIVQTSEAMAYFPPYIRKKTVIMPNPLHPSFLRKRYEGQRRDEIVTVGRLDDNKNQMLLIEAFSEIEKEYPTFTLHLYGDGESRQKQEQRVVELKLTGKVVFEGRQDAIYDKIEKARIFVLSSTVEGMPNALIEAMALGLAVISTDCPCGGPRDLILDGENGILINVNDKTQLVDAIKRILNNNELEETLGQNACKIQETLEPVRVNEMWRAYIESCIK